MRAALTSRRTRSLAGIALLLGLATLAAVSPASAATFAPAVLLLLALLRGIHPGERLLERLLTRRAARPRRVRRAVPWPALPLLPRRAGRTLAAALAMRPPPVAAGTTL